MAGIKASDDIHSIEQLVKGLLLLFADLIVTRPFEVAFFSDLQKIGLHPLYVRLKIFIRSFHLVSCSKGLAH